MPTSAPTSTLPNDATGVFDGSLSEPAVVAAGTGVAAVVSERSPIKDPPNEDAAAVIPLIGGGVALAVADGCGGHAAGEQAAQIAIRTLFECLHQPGEGEARGAVLDAFERANEAITGLGVGAGTTLAVAIVDAGAVRAYHAGDSEILLIGQRGRVKLQTLAHAPVAYGVEAGVIDPRDAMHHEDRSLISNLLGSAEMRIEVGAAVPLAARDTLILASDGVTDNLRTREIADLIRTGPVDAAARRLRDAAHRRMTNPQPGEPGKPDDLTFVLYRPARPR